MKSLIRAESVEVTAACLANKLHMLFVCDGCVPISGWCQCSYCRQSPGDGVSRMCCGADTASLPPHHTDIIVYTAHSSRSLALICSSCQGGEASDGSLSGGPAGQQQQLISRGGLHRFTTGCCPQTAAGQSRTARPLSPMHLTLDIFTKSITK